MAGENHGIFGGLNQDKIENDDDRKIFVGSLSQDVTEEDLRSYFSQYGEVSRVVVKLDYETGRSRGFAFVSFQSTDVADSVSQAKHTIKDSIAAVQKAEVRPGKIYVCRLKLEFSEDDLKNHFSQFGEVTAVEQPFDKVKNEKRNFCFISFKSNCVAQQLVKEGKTVIDGHECDIKRVLHNNNKWDDSGARKIGRGRFGGVATDQMWAAGMIPGADYMSQWSGGFGMHVGYNMGNGFMSPTASYGFGPSPAAAVLMNSWNAGLDATSQLGDHSEEKFDAGVKSARGFFRGGRGGNSSGRGGQQRYNPY